MKNRLTFYPFVRREFKTMEEVGLIINRSHSYVKSRFNGSKEFTTNDKRIIASYLGVKDEDINALFVKEV